MKGRKRFSKIVLFLFMIVPASWSAAAYGATLNVPATYSTIQAAIGAASVTGGDTILVANGTYSGEGNVNLTVNKPVRIESEGGPNQCIIDCQGNGRAFTFQSGAVTETLLKGFTIRGGRVIGSGGGILCEDGAQLTVEDCIITGNAADASSDYQVLGYGGGIACLNSSPVISNCHIEGNSSAIGGGGLYLLGSSAIVTRCTITENAGGFYGGGVYMESVSPKVSSPSFSSCMVTQNSAMYYGGGLYSSTNASPEITNCTVADNSTLDDAYAAGGGLYLFNGCSATITNSILWNNTAPEGPEIKAYFQCLVRVSFSTVKGGENSVAIDAAVSPMIAGTTSTTAAATYSTLEWLDKNTTDDPKFVDPDAGDYHLALDSPCVDAGTPDLDLPESDFEGDPRVINSNPDKGGDEYQPSISSAREVQIDVRPGSRHNQIDLGAWGFLPVAVLSTADFDATSIDPKTVKFAGARPMHSVRTHVNRDRKADMLFFFWIRQLELLDENSTTTPVTAEAILTGETKEKELIVGEETVTVIDPKHKRHWWHKFAPVAHNKSSRHSR